MSSDLSLPVCFLESQTQLWPVLVRPHTALWLPSSAWFEIRTLFVSEYSVAHWVLWRLLSAFPSRLWTSLSSQSTFPTPVGPSCTSACTCKRLPCLHYHTSTGKETRCDPLRSLLGGVPGNSRHKQRIWMIHCKSTGTDRSFRLVEWRRSTPCSTRAPGQLLASCAAACLVRRFRL